MFQCHQVLQWYLMNSGAISSWSVDQVVNWMKSLNLGEDYSGIIKQNHIDGDVLSVMKMEDFRELGIKAFGDVNKILRKVKEFQ